MPQNNKMTKLTGTATSNPDLLAVCIGSMVNVMKADFGHKFRSQFSSTEDLKLYKQRLYKHLEGRKIENIYSAYDNYVLGDNKWPPSVSEIIESLVKVEKSERQQEKDRKEIDKLVSLPKPAKKCDPMEMLSETKTIADKKNRTHEEWVEAKENLRINNDAVINLYATDYKVHADDEHLCKYPGCSRGGTISRSIGGSENWFCRQHFNAN